MLASTCIIYLVVFITCPAVHPVLSLLFIELSPQCLLLCVACNKAAVSLQPLVVESGVCLFTDCCQKFYTSFLLVYVVRHSVITFNISSVEHVNRDCYYHYMLPLHVTTAYYSYHYILTLHIIVTITQDPHPFVKK